MGNTLSFKAIDSCYVAIIKERILNRTAFLSIFELGDLKNIEDQYQYLRQPIEINIYDIDTNQRIYIPSYEKLKNREIAFVIKSSDKNATLSTVKYLRKLHKWTPNKQISIDELRPRTVIKLPKYIYNHIVGWRHNGLINLAHTETDADIKILYLEKKQLLIISSNDISANDRILRRLKLYKKQFKEHIKSH